MHRLPKGFFARGGLLVTGGWEGGSGPVTESVLCAHTGARVHGRPFNFFRRHIPGAGEYIIPCKI
ncbi:MAG: hypothetical protein A4E53_01125 [Pelotomaculum sp. PtaB.Bin104]|nr:MAG: hypothetical protein A4E53_01125 [Pelotomaculum sp. PtaB.Bin104]